MSPSVDGDRATKGQLAESDYASYRRVLCGRLLSAINVMDGKQEKGQYEDEEQRDAN